MSETKYPHAVRITDYELSHLILRFEQEKDMKVMHCVQNLAALRDLVDLRIEFQRQEETIRELQEDLREEQTVRRQADRYATQQEETIRKLRDTLLLIQEYEKPDVISTYAALESMRNTARRALAALKEQS